MKTNDWIFYEQLRFCFSRGRMNKILHAWAFMLSTSFFSFLSYSFTIILMRRPFGIYYRNQAGQTQFMKEKTSSEMLIRTLEAHSPLVPPFHVSCVRVWMASRHPLATNFCFLRPRSATKLTLSLHTQLSSIELPVSEIDQIVGTTDSFLFVLEQES